MKWWKNKRGVGLGLSLPANKALGIELVNDDYQREHNPVTIEANLSLKQDHAGLNFEFSLLGFGIQVELNDGRHWNNRAERWYFQGEEGDEMDKAAECRKRLVAWAESADQMTLRRFVLKNLLRTSVSGIIDLYGDMETEMPSPGVSNNA